MHFLAIPFPNIDPVLVQIGPVAIRWYALSYIAGFILGWMYLRYLLSKPDLWWPEGKGPRIATKAQADDILTWSILGVLIGGRVGWALFYQLLPANRETFLSNPLEIFYVWHGGMSFHGGFLGVVIAIVLFCRSQKLDIARIGDAIACSAPFGLCFGRVANFINAEIWGKPTEVSWAVVFPNDPLKLPRHPSQLYEAALEGVALFLILFWLTQTFKILRRPGLATGCFLILYSIFRIFVEVAFRDSNNKLGGGWTMGIVLSIPMAMAGLFYVWHAFEDRFGPMPLTRPLAKLSTHQAFNSK